MVLLLLENDHQEMLVFRGTGAEAESAASCSSSSCLSFFNSEFLSTPHDNGIVSTIMLCRVS